MENKRYLDKVVGSLVRSTEIDYEGKELYVPFTNYSFHMFFPSLYRHYNHFYEYCVKQFGLTLEEVDYVWDQWESIVQNKLWENEK